MVESYREADLRAWWHEIQDALDRGWTLVQKEGESYPPPFLIYRGGLYTYVLDQGEHDD